MKKVLSVHNLKNKPILVCENFPVGVTIKIVCENGVTQCKDFEVAPSMTLYDVGKNIGILIKEPIDFKTLGNPLEVE